MIRPDFLSSPDFIEDVLQNNHFRSGKELEATLLRYVWLAQRTATPAISFGQQATLANDEEIEQNETIVAQKTAILPGGMRHLANFRYHMATPMATMKLLRVHGSPAQRRLR